MSWKCYINQDLTAIKLHLDNALAYIDFRHLFERIQFMIFDRYTGTSITCNRVMYNNQKGWWWTEIYLLSETGN